MTHFVLTPDDLCEKLKLSRRTVYERSRKGEIPGAFKIGKHWRFRAGIVEQWIQEQIRTQTPAEVDV